MDIVTDRGAARCKLKWGRGPKVHRTVTDRKPGVKRFRKHSGGRERPSAGQFFWEAQEAKEPPTSGLIISFHHGQQTNRTYPPRNRAASGNRRRDHRPVPQLRKGRRTH